MSKTVIHLAIINAMFLATPTAVHATKPVTPVGKGGNGDAVLSCEKIKDKAIRLECFKSFAEASVQKEAPPAQSPTPAQPTLEEIAQPTIRAAKAVESATQVGVPLVRFGELLEALAMEIKLLRDNAKDEKTRDLAYIFEDALKMYKDSRQLWYQGIQSDNSSMSLQRGFIVPEHFGLSDIASKYFIPRVSLDMWGLNKGVNVNDGLRIIWAEASERLAQAYAKAKRG